MTQDNAAGLTPLMSVIIPSYNSRDKVERCLAALRAQRTDIPFEIIVVDSSDDGTAEVLQGIEDIVLVRSEERIFPGTARNRGAAAARGRLLCFIDADCLASEDWLQKIWDASPDAEGVVVGGGILNGTPESAVGTAEYFSELSGLLPGRPKREVEFLPGANFAIGALAFREAGGFRDYEKGSDVSFGSDCRSHGTQPVFYPDITVAHGNRTEARGFLKNQEKLGWGAGNNRVLHDLPGSWLTRHPTTWPLVPFARFSRITYHSLRDGGGQRMDLVKALPWIFLGSIWYGAGFARGARDGAAALEGESQNGSAQPGAQRPPRVMFNVAGQSSLSPVRGGAIEKTVANQANSMTGRASVTVFGDLSPLGEGVEAVRFTRNMRHSIKALPRTALSIAIGLPAILKVPADVIIATHSMNLVQSLLYSRLKRVPLISWETDHDPWVPPDGLLNVLYRRAVGMADLVITESSEQARRMIAAGIAADRISVIPLPVETDKYRPSDRRSDGDYLLYVAKFLPRKNQKVLIEAFTILSREREDLRLVFVGPKGGAYAADAEKIGPATSYFSECMDLVDKAGLSEKVTTLERLPEPELIELYQRCSLFVFPSLEEGFGLTVLEAMSCGCVVISNDIEPMREVVSDAGVLADTSGAERLARTIGELLDDPSRANALRERARNRAVAAFGGQAIHEEFATAVEDLLGRSWR